jgi:hypothetical protein
MTERKRGRNDKMGTLNPFLRDSQRKTARQVVVSNEARHILLAYEQWKTVRACQVWCGPVFLERALLARQGSRITRHATLLDGVFGSRTHCVK